MLGCGHAHFRDIDDLADHHTRLGSRSQIQAAPATRVRHVINHRVRIRGARQTRPRGAGLLARRTSRTRLQSPSRLGRPVQRRRLRRVTRVLSQPALQLHNQSLKLLDPLRLTLDHPRLRGHQREQLLTRRLHPRHPTIVHTRQSKARTDTPERSAQCLLKNRRPGVGAAGAD